MKLEKPERERERDFWDFIAVRPFIAGKEHLSTDDDEAVQMRESGVVSTT